MERLILFAVLLTGAGCLMGGEPEPEPSSVGATWAAASCEVDCAPFLAAPQPDGRCFCNVAFVSPDWEPPAPPAANRQQVH